MKTFLIITLTVLFVLLLATIGFTQPPPPALPAEPTQAPLGGLGLLAAAGGAYAYRKLRSKL